MTEMMTAFDVSLILRVTVRTVKNLVRRGELVAYRVGRVLRFAPADVAVYLDRYRINGDVNGR